MKNETAYQGFSVDDFKKYLYLNRSTGQLVWKPRADDLNFNVSYAGKEAFVDVTNGYKRGKLLGRHVYAHVVVFFMVYGYKPEVVDHINEIKTDNRIENLQPSDIQANSRAKSLRKNNSTGYTGVSKKGNMWVATGYHKNRKKHLGTFDEYGKAVEARRMFEGKYYAV